MDSRAQRAPRTRTGQEITASRGRTARDPFIVDDSLGPAGSTEPVPQPAAPEAPCTVRGVRVREFACLFSPCAFLITLDGGSHEITRCFMMSGRFALSGGFNRLGGLSVEGADYVPEMGLTLTMSKGYRVFVPGDRCQATWLPLST